MNLPNDIRLKIEKSPDKEDILLLLARLENDGVTITNDCPSSEILRQEAS